MADARPRVRRGALDRPRRGRRPLMRHETERQIVARASARRRAHAAHSTMAAAVMRRTSLYDRHARGSARASSNSAAGRCPSSTRASSRSTARSVRRPACSTSRTWASCSSRGPDAAAAPRVRARLRSAAAGHRAGALLDDLRPRRRHHRRPDRLPPRRGALPGGPNAANRAAVTEAAGASAWPASRPRLDDALAARPPCWPSRARGPRASSQPLVDADLAAAALLRDRRGAGWPAVPALVARTGYTGEDGFELFVTWDTAPALWDALMEQGRRAGLVPVGLGARDTLRLEAGMPLYGNELDRDGEPVRGGPGPRRQARQAGRLRRPRRPRARARDRPLTRHAGGPRAARARHRPPRLPGLVAAAPARPGSSRAAACRRRSASPIAMAYVARPMRGRGTMVAVEIRDGRVAAEVVPLPVLPRPPAPAAHARSRVPADRWRCPMVPGSALHRGPRVAPRARATQAWSASPATPPTSWGTSSSSSCPAVGTRFERGRRSASSSRSRPSATCSPRSRGEVTGGQRRRWPTSRSSSTPSRTAPAGWSGCASPTRPRRTPLKDAAAYARRSTKAG